MAAAAARGQAPVPAAAHSASRTTTEKRERLAEESQALSLSRAVTRPWYTLPMKGPLLGIVVVIALLAAGVIFYTTGTPTPAAPVLQTYSNDRYGISFSYPAGYVLSENDVSLPTEPRHHVITIIAEADAVPRQNSEGPTAITLDFYEQTIDTLPKWLLTTESNFALGNQKYATTSIDGEDSVTYSWSGLYEGETTALIHSGTLIATSVTYISPADAIVSAYQTVLTTMQLR